VVLASGWEPEGWGFEPWRLKATFDHGLQIKIQQKYSQPDSVPLIIYFKRRTLKDFFNGVDVSMSVFQPGASGLPKTDYNEKLRA